MCNVSSQKKENAENDRAARQGLGNVKRWGEPCCSDLLPETSEFLIQVGGSGQIATEKHQAKVKRTDQLVRIGRWARSGGDALWRREKVCCGAAGRVG